MKVTFLSHSGFLVELKRVALLFDDIGGALPDLGGKPLLVTEVGAGAVYGFRSTAKEIWSEERQKEILQKQLTEIAGYESCMGMYIWQFCDVRVCKEWAMHRPKSRNNKGIVDEYRRPKLVYGKVKEISKNYYVRVS